MTHEIIGAVALFLAILLFLVNTHLWFHRRGFKKGFVDGGFERGHAEGFKAGYSQGRLDADNWWITTEGGIDQARQKIWREEERRRG
jgi:hypothetical protein